MKRLRKSILGFGFVALVAAHSLAACSSKEAGDSGDDGNTCMANTASDPQNCGACGTICSVGQSCVGGMCKAVCNLPEVDCGGPACVDPASNSLHCGGCGQMCVSGQICANSMCTLGSCPVAQCAGACVDTQINPMHCGRCDAACQIGQTCQSGACVGGGGTGGSGGSGPTGGTGGAAPTGGTAGSESTGGSAGSGMTGGSGGGGAGMAGSAGMPPVVELPPLVTSAQNAYWQTNAMPTETTANATVTVNDTMTAQTWEGFGGSFNEIGWYVLMSQTMKDEAIKLLFSATEGANLVWGRIPMGASDYGRTRYTLADTGSDIDPVPNSGESNRPPADTALAGFSLTRDGMLLIPYIKAAQALKPSIRFWASPWTPPVWMKSGYKTNGGSGGNAVRPSYFDGGNMRNDSAMLAAYAQYFKKFVEGYKAQGINIEVVSPQNEPGYDQNYPSCLWDSATYTAFVGQHLGPAMMPLNVKVMLGTMSNNGDGGRRDLDIASAVVGNATARGFLSVFGAQWGVLDAINGGTAAPGGLPVWATEHKCGNYPWNPSGSPAYNNTQAPNDQAYAVESWGYIRSAIRNGKVTSYNAWNMVLDRLGLGNDTSRDWKQNALLVADGGQVRPTPFYHVFRHMAQYVAPGAVVVGTSGGDALGFKNPDGSIVAVMFNSGGANANYVVALGGKRFQFAMPGAGWATLKYKP